MKRYQIRDWGRHFEKDKSREQEPCSWCPIPNKQDGLGYRLIMREPDGAAIYGAFVAVVLMCSKQHQTAAGGARRARKGYLTKGGRADGCPLGALELSIKTQVPVGVMERMLEIMSSPMIGWVIATDCGDINE